MDGALTTPMAPASPAPPSLEANTDYAFCSAAVSTPIYGQLDLYAAVAADYPLMEELCRDQKLQIDRRQTQLQSYVEIAPRLATYVQQRYLDLWTDRQDFIESLHGFQTELARILGQDYVVRELKTALPEAEKKFKQVEDLRTRESSAAQQQLEAMTLRLAAVDQNSGGDLQAATAKASKYKKLSRRVDKKLDTTRLGLENMSKIHQDFLHDQELVEAELQIMRSDLADRDALVDRLRNQASNWEQ
uniref:Uncharacterized protein n=1 Tax=Peronospora matthiolae TaxID=2874970 RepID=A0AAV1V0Z5_9STRA